jgi:ankyrin repeat protein
MRLKPIGGALCLAVAIGVGASAADTRVADAVKSGNVAAVRSLLQQRAPVDAAEPDGTTALHWAARADRPDLVQMLLRAGAQANGANRYGVTPLALAAVNGSAAVIEQLLDAGANPNAVAAEGETALMTASRTGRADAVRLLLDKGADPNAQESWMGETALMWAAGHNHPAVVTLLATRGASLDVRSKAPEFPKVKVDLATMVTTALPRGGFTAAMLAARQGAAEAIDALADAGADLDAGDPDGTTALNLAIINAHYEAAARLIERGANPNIGDSSGMTPLYAAIDMQYQDPLINRPLAKPSGPMRPMDVVKLLLAHGADPNARLRTPLLMRQHNAGDGQLGEGATPLMRASKVSAVEFMRTLLDKGADPNLRLKNQTTALMIAAARAGRNAGPEQGTIDAMALLLDRGADINAANDNGETALHIAVPRGDALVRFLAERGANLSAKDKFERTALDVAMGVAGGGGGRGRGGRGAPAAPVVRESTAALLRELAAARPAVP